MQHPTHPDDERLAALAGGDPEVASDAALRAHVDSCDRCADIVRELGSLRTALAELPDLVPSRPLQLLPPVAEPRAAARGGWLRRLAGPGHGGRLRPGRGGRDRQLRIQRSAMAPAPVRCQRRARTSRPRRRQDSVTGEHRWSPAAPRPPSPSARRLEFGQRGPAQRGPGKQHRHAAARRRDRRRTAGAPAACSRRPTRASRGWWCWAWASGCCWRASTCASRSSRAPAEPPASLGQPPGDDRGNQHQQHHDPGQHGRPAAVAERPLGGRHGRRTPGRHHRALRPPRGACAERPAPRRRWCARWPRCGSWSAAAAGSRSAMPPSARRAACPRWDARGRTPRGAPPTRG